MQGSSEVQARHKRGTSEAQARHKARSSVIVENVIDITVHLVTSLLAVISLISHLQNPGTPSRFSISFETLMGVFAEANEDDCSCCFTISRGQVMVEEMVPAIPPLRRFPVCRLIRMSLKIPFFTTGAPLPPRTTLKRSTSNNNLKTWRSEVG